MLMFLKKMKKNQKGYTLTELIVVVAILGILAAVATPMVLNQIGRARTSADNANAKTIENAYKIGMSADPTPDTPTTKDQALAIIDDNLNPFPTIQQSGFAFFLNTSTGEVTCVVNTTTSTTTLLNLTTPTK